MPKIVLGMDGGGTYTRFAASDPEGNVLTYVKWEGASSFYKDLGAGENVKSAILKTIRQAGCEIGDVIGLAAGIAGLDEESDLKWARELTRIEGMECGSLHVNDAVVAHRGAFLAGMGIMAVSGTGSIIFGVTESGREIRNYDFSHYASTAARYISYDAVHQILSGRTDLTDEELVKEALCHFGVKGLPEFVRLGSEGFLPDRRARDKWFGDFAPAITKAALSGSQLAVRICDRAVESIITGIRLVGACFASDSIPVALIGGVANSAYIQDGIRISLERSADKSYQMTEPALPAAFGAILMAMGLIGIETDELMLARLRKGAESAG